jgi:copper transport protein
MSERRLRPIALAAGLVAAVTVTLVSHAAAYGTPQGIAIDLVHTLSAAAWAGGVVAMLAVTLPVARAFGPGELGRIVGRFSTFAVVSVAVLVLTGVLQSVQRLVLIQDLWETPYGIAVLAKVALLAAALVLAAFNLLRWGPALRRGGEDDRARRWLGRDVRGETAAIVLILVATALLTALVPPAQTSGAAYQSTRHAGGMRLQLLLASASPGQNRYVLRVSEGLAPVTDALRVALRFTMIEHDMGESEIVAEQRAPGEYAANGNVTAMYGTWRIEALVRRPERADVRTTFEVPIAAPTGPGAVARVVQAPPYTMVVYVDPIQPAAGAPVIINIVLVDAKGDPVAGKALRVTLVGPSTETVEAKEVSIGRYDAAVAALAAGRWTARIEIGSEARGEYAFDVAR